MLQPRLVMSRRSTRAKNGFDLPWWCDAEAAKEPLRFLQYCPKYRPTPLVCLDGLAGQLRLGSLHVKDESGRLGLGSFKALGGAYAVLRVAQRHAEARQGRAVPPAELLSPEATALLKGLTFCCASDGNHGRSVAAGARLIGAKCVVFLHANVSGERVAHIERLGASVVRVEGSYDASVATAAKTASYRDWVLVADTAMPHDEQSAEICGFVMQGYTVLVAEILEQAAAAALDFTHVFVQAGVGGLAASVFGHWTAAPSLTDRPRFIVVEPEQAACVLESARAGRWSEIPEGPSTIMSMLECQSPSPLAWPVIQALADGYIAVSDDDAGQAVRQLVRPVADDAALEVGESGAAGLAGLMRALAEQRWRGELGLGRDSRILVIATECPTDRSAWSGQQAKDKPVSSASQ